jgi:hypothetical protein
VTAIQRLRRIANGQDDAGRLEVRDLLVEMFADLETFEQHLRSESARNYDEYVAGGRLTHSTCGQGDAYLSSADMLRVLLTEPRGRRWWPRE